MTITAAATERAFYTTTATGEFSPTTTSATNCSNASTCDAAGSCGDTGRVLFTFATSQGSLSAALYAKVSTYNQDFILASAGQVGVTLAGRGTQAGGAYCDHNVSDLTVAANKPNVGTAVKSYVWDQITGATKCTFLLKVAANEGAAPGFDILKADSSKF